MAAGNLMTSSPGDSVHVRIISPELDFQTLIVFSPDDTAWQAKQKVISTACPDRKDVLNFGLYCPSVNNRAGKFLDEERLLRDYPMPGPIGLLEFKYKKRVYKTQFNPTKLKKLHSASNLKKFMDYVYKGNADKITELTNKGLDPNFSDGDKGETPMTAAANLPRPRSVMLALVSGGAYLDFRNRKGLTALHVAAEAGNRDAIKTLLDLGASPNYKDGQGLTPLFYCVAKGNGMAQCLQMMLHDRAEVCNRDENGWTEIHHACLHGKVQHLEHLLFYGADINAKNSSGDTALHICARYNEEECARALLFRGADKTLKNKSDEDAVTMARLAGHTKVEDVISNFRPEGVVLYTELPKYNEKRRGTISMATIRNLQRSRSNPQLNQLFSQDSNYAASLSSAGGYQVLSNSFLFGNAKHQRESAHGQVIPADSLPRSSVQLHSESEPRTLVLHKDQTGFGFVLRGAKSRSGTGTGTGRLKFQPTPYCPALQFFDSVEKGSVAEHAGLLSGDYLLEVNGESVISASHDYTVALIKNSGNQVTLKVVTAKRRPKENGDSVHSTAGDVVVAKASPASISPSIGSQMKSSLAGLQELERLDASLDEYESQTVAQASANAVPIYSTVYRERRSLSQNQLPVSDYRTSIYVSQSSIDSNRSIDHVSEVNGFANGQEPEPEPDYDDGPVAEAVPCSVVTTAQEVGTKEDTEDLGSSSFALLIKQATLNRERRIKERERLDVVVGTKQEMAPPVVSANRNGSVPLPPPPPPPPISSPGDPEQSHRRSGSDSGKPVPPEVQKHLDENRKRDEAHAALMAAVLKRRNLLENTDEVQVADSIDTRLQKSRKIQVIYRGDHSTENLTSPTKPRPNSLYTSVENNGSLGKSAAVNGNGMFPEGPRAGMGVSVHSTPTGDLSGLMPKKAVPQTSSHPPPNGSVRGSSGDLVLLLTKKGNHRLLSNEQESAAADVHSKIVPGLAKEIRTPKQPAWTNEQTYTPALVNRNVTGQAYGFTGSGYPRTDVTRYSERYANEDAASTISTLSTLSTLSSLSPENPSSAGSSPPHNQSGYMSKANDRNQLHTRLDLSLIPEGIVGVMIPPPAEFLGDEPSPTNQRYNALPVKATLRTVNKTPLGNSMVFPALIKDYRATGNEFGKSSFAEKSLDSWSVGDVGEWLDSLDYGFYQERFAEMNINGERLAQLDENDMQMLGVEQVLHRIKLVREVRKLRKGPGLQQS